MRTDAYVFEVEAEDQEQLQEMLDTDSEYLNIGSYAGSEFEVD